MIREWAQESQANLGGEKDEVKRDDDESNEEDGDDGDDEGFRSTNALIRVCSEEASR